eukprot:TRINITY_DN20298_c0_g1_i1.p1 TRINITY_DN20298_c0_g1~~TRINITY_DN20298_c0_g1_i1.p1  ORF type:complete len:174 (+),score=19.95 TRINITY_DN20298_c0_g1_i1:49-570(+)
MLQRTVAVLRLCTLPSRGKGKWRLYVDLDGVLVDFEHGVIAAGEKVSDLKHHPQRVWATLSEVDNFFEKLPWMPGAEAMWKELKKHSPIILTGLPRGTWAEPQKRAWVATHLGPDVTVIACMKHEKPLLSSKGNILIDDAEDTCDKWRSNGGIAILHETPDATLDQLAKVMGV